MRATSVRSFEYWQSWGRSLGSAMTNLILRLTSGSNVVPYKVPSPKGLVRIDQKSVEHGREHRAVASVLTKCLADLLFYLLVAFPHRSVHGHVDQYFFIG